MARTGMKQGRVFVSHSSNDYSDALEICRAIEGRGARCAIAPRDVPPGASYADWIGETIENASAFVLVLSKASIVSNAVLAELELAFNSLGLPIYPVRVDPVQRDDLPPGIRYFISAKQMFDAIRPLRQNALDRLSKSIARDLLSGAQAPDQRKRQQVTAEQDRIAGLWARMEASNSSLGWLGEAAIGGPLWLFYRGMNPIGFLLTGLLALLVLGAGIAGDLESAALVLIFGWAGLALFLGIVGPAMLRRHVSGQASRIRSGGSEAIGPAIISLGALAAALGLGALAGNAGKEPGTYGRGVETGPVQADQLSPSDPSAGSGNPRQPGNPSYWIDDWDVEPDIPVVPTKDYSPVVEHQIDNPSNVGSTEVIDDPSDAASAAASDAAADVQEAM